MSDVDQMLKAIRMSRQKLAKKNGYSDADINPVCPHCGEDCSTYEEMLGEEWSTMECSHCGQTFECRVDFRYSTRKGGVKL